MPDKDSSTPRIFLLRHGPTEWSQSGRYTGTTDIPLLPSGESLIRSTASHVFGPGKLIDPERLVRVYVSPRVRARRTLEILFETKRDRDAGGIQERGEEMEKESKGEKEASDGLDVRVTEDVTEWNYGEYEGLLTHEIRALRKSQNLDTERQWDIWRDGCAEHGGETPGQITERIDRVIGEIVAVHERYLRDVKEGSVQEGRRRDVLVVAHGHVLRGFVKRWLGLDMGMSIEFMLEPGGICGLSYAHGRVQERAVLVGMAFPGGV